MLIVLNFMLINLYLRPKSPVPLMDMKVNQIVLFFGRKVELIKIGCDVSLSVGGLPSFITLPIPLQSQ